MPERKETYPPYRPESWDIVVKAAVERAYEELNTTKKPKSKEDIDRVLIEAGADALLVELMDHGCKIEKGEEFNLQRVDHVDHISGPGWLVLIPQ